MKYNLQEQPLPACIGSVIPRRLDMKPMVTTILAAVVAATALSASPSTAGPNANASIALHLLTPTLKNFCTRAGTQPACWNVDATGDLNQGYYAHVLVMEGSAAAGVAGVQFGIEYGSGMLDGTGIDIFDWTLCATLEFPQPTPVWPNNGGGTLITWDSTNNCQQFEPGGAGTGVTANVGFFYLAAYTPASMRITVRPVDGIAKVASCAAEEDYLNLVGNRGRADFGVGFGNVPCFSGDCFEEFCVCHPEECPTPTIPSTWSKVKSQYR
jgi:hypothetical protein